LTGETSIGEEVLQNLLADWSVKESGKSVLVLLVASEIRIGTKQRCEVSQLMHGERQADGP
jgi:hypothetical protein